MTQEERGRFNVLIKEVKENNEMRTEEEKQKFYWRILDLKVKKWYLQINRSWLVGWFSIVSQFKGHTDYLEPVNVVRW